MAIATTNREAIPTGLVAAARFYAGLGYRVFPLEPGGATPLDTDALAAATTDLVALADTWAAEPMANIGIATGAGLVAIEADADEGLSSLINLYDEAPELQAYTVEAETPHGGAVLFYSPPQDFPLPSRQEPLPGLTVHGDGSYVVAPPSVLGPSGWSARRWRWRSMLGATPVATLPDGLAERLTSRVSLAGAKPVSLSEPGGKSYEQLLQLPNPPAIVEDLLWPGTVNMVFGSQGVGKTFYALMLGLHVTHGVPIHGLKVDKAPVYYVAQEGQRRLGTRVQAAYERTRLYPSMETWTAPVTIGDTGAWRTFVDWCLSKPAGLMAFDTLSRVLGRFNIDDNRDAGLVFNELRPLTDHGHTVLFVSHPGHTHQERPAGAHTWLRNCDTILRMSRRGKALTLTTFKNRDSEHRTYHGSLASQDFISASSGKPETTLVFVPSETVSTSGDQAETADLDRALIEAVTIVARQPGRTSKECQEAHVVKPPDTTWRRTRNRAIDLGYIRADGSGRSARFYLTEEGRDFLRENGIEAGEHVSVDPSGSARVGVPEASGDGRDGDTIGDEQASVKVPEVVNT